MSTTYTDPTINVTFKLTGETRMTDDGLMHEVLDTSWDAKVWWSDVLVNLTFGEAS